MAKEAKQRRGGMREGAAEITETLPSTLQGQSHSNSGYSPSLFYEKLPILPQDGFASHLEQDGLT